jgi:outer membrane lipoprotein
MPSWKFILVTVGSLALGACATIPKPLAGSYAQVSPRNAGSGTSNQQSVRWGGAIISTEPESGQTCFTMLALPLDSSARPQSGSASEGRFVACHSGFYDPAVFERGREVTFTGTINGVVSKKVGKYDYPYPRLDAQTVYLWPKRTRYMMYRDPWYDPWFGPYSYWGAPGYWGPYYNPYLYAPPSVIVVPQNRRLAPAVKQQAGH